MATCKICNGSGHGKITCPTCKGAGINPQARVSRLKCQFCGGSGFLKCGTCHGKGFDYLGPDQDEDDDSD